MPFRQLKSAAGGIPQLVALGFQRGQALGSFFAAGRVSSLSWHVTSFWVQTLSPDLGRDLIFSRLGSC